MRILTVILARGDSKRLPKKNIKMLGGKPLISWTIDLAFQIPESCAVLVSTDNREIAEIALKTHALTPWLRPKKLATDNATSVDAAIHALEWYESKVGAVDGLLLLQPTSPFRTLQTVLDGIELFKNNNKRSVVCVTQVDKLKSAIFTINHGFLVAKKEVSAMENYKTNSDFFEPNGVLYLISPEDIRSQKSFYGLNTIPLIVKESKETLDIDTEWDFQIAQKFVE